ncbi:MAG: glycosyltransferase family 39 protein [Candidatus Magasanikbacteria bacterium]|nr:glycosyltransferase family 39 protein [Candidatus Magasanikbacteria bacterium]
MKFWFKKHYPLFIVLATAAALRINLLFVRGTWWFDEMFSVHYSLLPWGQAIKYWLLETNPFLYNLVLRGWMNLLGQGEMTVRIPSLIFGLITIAFVYYLGQKWISRRAAIVSSLIISLSGIHLFVSTETRTYALFTLLTALSFYWFINIFVEKKIGRWTWPLFFLTQVALLYSHLTALTVIIIQVLTLVYFKTADRASRKKFLLTQCFSLLIWSLWFTPSFLQKLNAGSLRGWFFTYDTNSSNIFTNLTTLFVNTGVPDFVLALFAIILLGIIFYALKVFPQQGQKNKNLLFILMLWSFVPAALGAFLGQYVTKYFVFSLPGFALLIAWTFDQITDKTARLAITALFLVIFIPSTLTIATGPIFSWYTITKYIEKNEVPKSAILVIPFNEELVIKKYYRGQVPVEGVYPLEDNLSLEERIVRYNWQSLLSSNGEYDAWMAEHTKNRDKIFFLQYDSFEGKGTTWFVNHGWKFKKRVRAVGHIGITMFEFDAPDYYQTTSSTSARAN